MLVDWKKVGIFVGTTYGVSLLWIFGYLAMGGQKVGGGALIVTTMYMFIPLISAFLVQKWIYRQPAKQAFGISFKWSRWYWLAWLFPFPLAFAVLGISLLFPGVSYSPGMEGMYERLGAALTPEQLEQTRAQFDALPFHPLWLALFQALLAGITLNALIAFGEEIGWRGFLLKELAPLGFWKASFLIGIIWGIWHAPVILQGHNYPQHPNVGVWMMIAWAMLWGPIFNYIRLKCQSVLGASILHGSINASAGLPLMMIHGGSDLTVGLTGFAGFLVLAGVNIILLLIWRWDPVGFPKTEVLIDIPSKPGIPLKK